MSPDGATAGEGEVDSLASEAHCLTRLHDRSSLSLYYQMQARAELIPFLARRCDPHPFHLHVPLGGLDRLAGYVASSSPTRIRLISEATATLTVGTVSLCKPQNFLRTPDRVIPALVASHD